MTFNETVILVCVNCGFRNPARVRDIPYLTNRYLPPTCPSCGSDRLETEIVTVPPAKTAPTPDKPKKQQRKRKSVLIPVENTLIQFSKSRRKPRQRNQEDQRGPRALGEEKAEKQVLAKRFQNAKIDV